MLGKISGTPQILLYNWKRAGNVYYNFFAIPRVAYMELRTLLIIDTHLINV